MEMRRGSLALVHTRHWHAGSACAALLILRIPFTANCCALLVIRIVNISTRRLYGGSSILIYVAAASQQQLRLGLRILLQMQSIGDFIGVTTQGS